MEEAIGSGNNSIYLTFGLASFPLSPVLSFLLLLSPIKVADLFFLETSQQTHPESLF